MRTNAQCAVDVCPLALSIRFPSPNHCYRWHAGNIDAIHKLVSAPPPVDVPLDPVPPEGE